MPVMFLYCLPCTGVGHLQSSILLHRDALRLLRGDAELKKLDTLIQVGNFLPFLRSIFWFRLYFKIGGERVGNSWECFFVFALLKMASKTSFQFVTSCNLISSSLSDFPHAVFMHEGLLPRSANGVEQTNWTTAAGHDRSFSEVQHSCRGTTNRWNCSAGVLASKCGCFQQPGWYCWPLLQLGELL